MIQRHNEVLDNLMQQSSNKMAITAVETIHRIGTINFKFSSSLVWKFDTDNSAEDQNLNGMECVRGAGRNTAKNCLSGTRENILFDIKCWLRSTGEDVPHILWCPLYCNLARRMLHCVWFTRRDHLGMGCGDWRAIGRPSPRPHQLG
jgi:hypothetical protein